MVQKLTGLVLRTTEYKESDLILNILTREQGLISAKARAVRTNRSHNKGACQLLCYSEFTITDYKGFSAISEANAIEMFPELRTDIELLSLASYFAQAAEVLSQEDAGSGEVLSLTLNALYALAKLRKPQDLVKAAFELRLACIGGYEPDLTGCAVCGRADCGRFLVSGGCLQCLECGLGEGLSLPVSAGCLGRDAVYHGLRCEAAFFVFARRPGPQGADRRGGDVSRDAARAWILHTGFLQITTFDIGNNAK